MSTVLIVIHLIIVVALCGLVLIQRSEGGGLGIGGGSGFMSARGTANTLTRTTAILAALFFATSLGLSVLARYSERPTDILDQIQQNSQGGQNEDGGNLLDQLGGGISGQPDEQPAQPEAGIPTGGDALPSGAPAEAPAPTGEQTQPEPQSQPIQDQSPAVPSGG